MVVAQEESQADLILQLVKPLAQRRLIDVQSLGSSGEVQLLGQNDRHL
jgi:hypothetical protein